MITEITIGNRNQIQGNIFCTLPSINIHIGPNKTIMLKEKHHQILEKVDLQQLRQLHEGATSDYCWFTFFVFEFFPNS